jgi:hypothetical protein
MNMIFAIGFIISFIHAIIILTVYTFASRIPWWLSYYCSGITLMILSFAILVSSFMP